MPLLLGTDRRPRRLLDRTPAIHRGLQRLLPAHHHRRRRVRGRGPEYRRPFGRRVVRIEGQADGGPATISPRCAPRRSADQGRTTRFRDRNRPPRKEARQEPFPVPPAINELSQPQRGNFGLEMPGRGDEWAGEHRKRSGPARLPGQGPSKATLLAWLPFLEGCGASHPLRSSRRGCGSGHSPPDGQPAPCGCAPRH